ncbi:hypothetical protein [Magnetococcus sp. PR-3]|uniref:hypothetical protein n=1 Tax=Magnetococcus sp. PR-3 TaxID=3120355 RepID=UPI002FCE3D3B
MVWPECFVRLGLAITVAAPSRTFRPVSSTNKTDRLVCRKLAEFAASGLLRPIASFRA